MTGPARPPIDLAPEAYASKLALEAYIKSCGLSPDLAELVKLRVSMINGCAFCIDMHGKSLRAAGISEGKLYGLPAWRETPGYSARERAALAWAESVNAVATTRVPDADYLAASAVFSPKELVDLTYVVVAITGWNQLCVALRKAPAP
jgi:AhpD family alkylhydroperoxidase